MAFIFSSWARNIVMTSLLRNEENSENGSAVGKPAFDLQQSSYLCLLLWMPFTFLPQTAPFSVKITQNVSRLAAVSRCLIGEHGESICHGKRHPCLSLAAEPAVLIAHYLSDYDAPLSEAGDYTTKYHLLRNLFSLYHSECCVLLLRRAPHLLSLFLSLSFHLPT